MLLAGRGWPRCIAAAGGGWSGVSLLTLGLMHLIKRGVAAIIFCMRSKREFLKVDETDCLLGLVVAEGPRSLVSSDDPRRSTPVNSSCTSCSPCRTGVGSVAAGSDRLHAPPQSIPRGWAGPGSDWDNVFAIISNHRRTTMDECALPPAVAAPQPRATRYRGFSPGTCPCCTPPAGVVVAPSGQRGQAGDRRVFHVRAQLGRPTTISYLPACPFVCTTRG